MATAFHHPSKTRWILVTGRTTPSDQDGYHVQSAHYWCGPEWPTEWHSRPESFRAGTRRIWLTPERARARRYECAEDACAAALLGPEGMFHVEVF